MVVVIHVDKVFVVKSKHCFWYRHAVSATQVEMFFLCSIHDEGNIITFVGISRTSAVPIHTWEAVAAQEGIFRIVSNWLLVIV